MNFLATPNRAFASTVQDAWWETGIDDEPQPISTLALEATRAAEAFAPHTAPVLKTGAGRAEILAVFDRAERAATAGDWRTAAELFLTMVESSPLFGPGYVGLASASFAIGDVATGAMALEHAITIYPDNPILHSQLGVALAHSGHLERAQEAFLKVLELEPHNVDAIISLAHLCRASRHFIEAVELLDQAHSLEPNNANVIGAIGTCALDLGDRVSAEASYRRLVALDPQHAEVQLLAERLAR